MSREKDKLIKKLTVVYYVLEMPVGRRRNTQNQPIMDLLSNCHIQDRFISNQLKSVQCCMYCNMSWILCLSILKILKSRNNGTRCRTFYNGKTTCWWTFRKNMLLWMVRVNYQIALINAVMFQDELYVKMHNTQILVNTQIKINLEIEECMVVYPYKIFSQSMVKMLCIIQQ